MVIQRKDSNQGKEKVVLYYFSGSGNTKKVAVKVEKTFNGQGYDCVMERMEKVQHIELDDVAYVGLIFPVAMQSTFPLVWEFIEGLPETKGQKIFMLDTMELFSGGIVGPVKKALQAKGYQCIAAMELKMSSSMCTKRVDMDKIQDKNKRALIAAEEFIQSMLIGQGKWRRIPLLSDIMRSISKSSAIWRKMSVRIGINHEQCVLCKKCINNCPAKAMDVKEGIVEIDPTICNSCMRCVHQCPRKAFTLGGKEVVRIHN